MTPPPLSPAEAATVARFDAAPHAPEAVLERVARAMAGTESVQPHEWGRFDAAQRESYYRLARAALAVLRGELPPTAHRCEAGCGCRYGTDDPDRLDCGCDGPCTRASDDVWEGTL